MLWLLQLLYQNTNDGISFGKMVVYTCRINTKGHWNYSFVLRWPKLRHFMLVFPLISGLIAAHITLIMKQHCSASFCHRWWVYCLFFFFFVDRVTEVKTDIYVTSFGPVSDADMVKYSFLPVITCYVLRSYMSFCIIPLSHILSPCLSHGPTLLSVHSTGFCYMPKSFSRTPFYSVSQVPPAFKYWK